MRALQGFEADSNAHRREHPTGDDPPLPDQQNRRQKAIRPQAVGKMTGDAPRKMKRTRAPIDPNPQRQRQQNVQEPIGFRG